MKAQPVKFLNELNYVRILNLCYTESCHLYSGQIILMNCLKILSLPVLTIGRNLVKTHRQSACTLMMKPSTSGDPDPDPDIAERSPCEINLWALKENKPQQQKLKLAVDSKIEYRLFEREKHKCVDNITPSNVKATTLNLFST